MKYEIIDVHTALEIVFKNFKWTLLIGILLLPLGVGAVILVLLPFICHYIYRSFIFPFLLRGKSLMPITIVLMGLVFNTVNASLISTWCFYLCPAPFYSYSYFMSPTFIIGSLIFLIGFIANIDSDAYIRRLRKV
ncbi:hypothetical protein, partial [uncultured Campylobacter sp.]|uniref:hypothetical protein n=1 Tax=uncultured Campylobacter sp. TaxID=218934 RepID=UPI00262CC213